MAHNRRDRVGFMLAAALLAGCAGWAPGASSAAMPWSTPNREDPGALEAQISLARLSERHNQPENAERIYQAVLQKAPNHPTAHHRLGVLAAKNGQFGRADQHFQMAARSGPPSPELLNDIGYNLFAMDRLQEAEATFRRALDMAPHHTAARNNLALVLGGSGRYAESLAEFRKVVGEAEAYANLAFIKTRRGDFEGAASDYHRALSLNPELRPAAEALIQLSQYQAAQGQLARSQLAANQTRSQPGTQMADGSARPTTGAEQPRTQVPAFFEVIERPAPRRTLTTESVARRDQGTGPTVPQGAEAALQSPRYAANAPSGAVLQPSLPAVSPSPRFAGAAMARQPTAPASTPSTPPDQRFLAARPRQTLAQPQAPAAPAPPYVATANPQPPTVASNPAAPAPVSTDGGTMPVPAQASRAGAPPRPFVRAEIVYGRPTPMTPAPQGVGAESVPGTPDAPVQLASDQNPNTPDVMPAVHETQVANPAAHGPAVESPMEPSNMTRPAGATTPRFFFPPPSAYRPSPSPSQADRSDLQMLSPRRLAGPLEGFRQDAEPGNGVTVAPPANSAVREMDAAAGPENAASKEAPAADGPTLGPPLNHWQRPTWVPVMGVMRPLGVNGMRQQASQ